MQVGSSPEQGQAPRLAAGVRLGRYEIASPIGKGGMGEVYRARDTELHRDVAIKVLPAESGADPERLRRFTDEARTMGQVSHANVIAIYDWGTSDGLPFVVTELLDGETLRAIVARGAVDAAKAADLALQVARGLAAAHAKGVVHRDLKPANVFVTRHGEVKILDFGLAKLVEPPWDALDPDRSTATITTPGLVMGTIGYMSPEQLEGHRIDARSDIFSFGAVLYEMLTGQRAFDGSSPASVAAAILHTEPRYLADEPKLPSALLPIVRRCLEKKPDARFQSAADLVFALEQQVRSSARPSSTGTLAAIRSGMSRPGVRRGAAFSSLTVVLILSLLMASSTRGPAAPASRSESSRPLRMTRITTTGDVVTAGISPDAVYVAYATRGENGFEIRLRHVPTGSEVPLGSSSWVQTVRISPDRNHVYYSAGETPALYRIPLLGGEARKLIDGVGSFAISRDGGRIAFIRHTAGESEIWIAGADGGQARRVVRFTQRRPHVCAWSPDSTTLACTASGDDPPRLMLFIDVATGRTEERQHAFSERRSHPAAFEWADDGTIVGATGPFVGALWRWPASGASSERLTSDLAGYGDVTLARAARAIAATQVNTIFNLLRVDLDDPTRPHLITSGFNTLDGRMGVSTLRDGRILYSSNASGRSEDIWITNADGSGKRRITVDDVSDEVRPVVAPDESFMLFIRRSDASAFELWRADLSGENARKLTDHAEGPSVTVDGGWIYFTRNGDNGPRLYRMPSGGGAAEMLFDRRCAHVTLSPDGVHAMATCWDPQPKNVIWRLDGKGEELSFPGFHRRHRWRPDGKAYVHSGTGPKANLWLQPLDGSPPKQITSFPDEGYGGFEWSRDGRSLIVPRWQSATDIVLLTETE